MVDKANTPLMKQARLFGAPEGASLNDPIHAMLLRNGRPDAVAEYMEGKLDVSNPEASHRYLHKLFVLGALPLKEVRKEDGSPATTWSREAPRVRMDLISSDLGGQLAFKGTTPGIPFGRTARLLFLYIFNQLAKNEYRLGQVGRAERSTDSFSADNPLCICFGDGWQNLVEELGLSYRNHLVLRVRQQIRRIASLNAVFTYRNPPKKGAPGEEPILSGGGEAYRLFEKFKWSGRRGSEPFLSHLVLGRAWYDFLTAGAERNFFPLEIGTLRAAASARSCLVFDMFTFVHFKLSYVAWKRRERGFCNAFTIPWEELMLQFGSQTRRADKFQSQLREALNSVFQIDPERKGTCSFETEGLKFSGKGGPSVPLSPARD